MKSVKLLGLLACLLGLALLDRSFAHWRNDPRSLPFANGRYPTSAEIDPALRGRFTNRARLKPTALAGAGLLGISVVLFGMFPVNGPRNSAEVSSELPGSAEPVPPRSSPDQH